MNRFTMGVPLLLIGGTTQAHVAQLPPIQHAAEHGGLVLPLLVLLALLVPAALRRRG